MDRQKQLEKYCALYSTVPHSALATVERNTGLRTLAPQMLTGSLQGSWLYLLTRMQQPRRVLEVGTFTAYATICMAAALPPDGLVITIEANAEYGYLIRQHLDQAGVAQQVQALSGDARELIPTLEPGFDLIYLDANKQDYTWYYDLLVPLLNPGGLLLADNVLWSGKVVFEPEDPDARVLHAFNEKVLQDERVEKVIIPLRDGLLIARKR